jgi:hypothetical protein
MAIVSKQKYMFSDALAGEVVEAYGLKRSASTYQVWTGLANDCAVTLEQGYDKKNWYLTAGDLGPHAEAEDCIWLERYDPAKVEEGLGPDEEIDGVLKVAGPAVTAQYLVAAEPESGDWSALQHPAVGDILPRFSAAVEMVELYGNRQAVRICLQREGLDRLIFDRDLALAVELAKALCSEKGKR